MDQWDDMRYHTSRVSRRAFVGRLLRIGGSLTAASPVLRAKGTRLPQRGTEPGDEASIEASTVAYPTEVSLGMTRGETAAYFAHPRTGASFPAIVIIHDDLGLNDSIMAITRRAASAGYLAIAPDFLSRIGGTDRFTDPQSRQTAASKMDPGDIASDVQGAIGYLRSTNWLNGRIGVLGFGWGADQALRAATFANIHACAVIGGITAEPALIARLRAPLLAIFASEAADSARLSAFERALAGSSRAYEIHRYDGVRPGFHDDTDPASYDAAASQDAWERTIRHFDLHLKG